ncbi:O-antigen ligase family protein [Herbaspirillum rubrisubalbicans]|uniref:O-antigen ligase family protein n=1 Tax=Herbaspirillum rubrisubalbicans TaxID=80842 RepID=UPI00155930F5|nr:O-antigen ligase family protein [Herbaspirillum rubrisubalbicans]NQE51218.1 lipid A core--O-antigen ligase [Herbaspirillum rubrisubalbicans]
MGSFTSFAVFLFSAISLIIPSGFSVGAVLLSLGSITLVNKSIRSTLSREDRLLIAVLVIYFLVTVTMHLYHHESLKEYDLPLRFLLAAMALLTLRAYPPSPAGFWSGLILGGVGSCLFAGWQYFAHGARANGYTNAIQYGDISFIIGILCLTGFTWALQQRSARTWVILLIVGGITGLLGSLFTGSRGSWVGLPVCLLILCVYYSRAIQPRYVWGGLVALIAAIVVVFAVLPSTDYRARVTLAFSEASTYMHKKDADSSIGTRMEMWRTGAMAAAESPLLGIGKAGFVAWESKQIEAGKVNPLMSGNNHVYNEWLDALVKRGIPGLLVLLALYFIPLRLFIAHLKSAPAHAKPYALGGILLIVNFIGFGFSQVFMAHNSGVMTLGFTMVILWGLLRGQEEGH